MTRKIETEKDREFLSYLGEALMQGLVIADKETREVIYSNPKGVELLGEELAALGVNLFAADIPQALRDLLNEDGDGDIEWEDGSIRHIAVKEQEGSLFISVADRSAVADLQRENRNLHLLNRQLRSVYELYNVDTITITDNKGIIIFAGGASARHCGITSQDLIGMSMQDLEKDKCFYPAVTPLVLKSGKEEVALQDTGSGSRLCTIGVPIFDEEDKLQNVVTISWTYHEEVEMAMRTMQAARGYQDVETDEESPAILTCSNAMLTQIGAMKKAARSNSTILIEGETGTGKSLLASYIHNESKRRDKPFITINCGAIPENLIESELYGYEPGTFTGADRKGRPGLIEEAQGGTVFFDEIGELPLQQQVKLLHVLQNRTITRVGGRNPITVDVRVIAATNRNLEKMVAEGSFREDLYYRLNVIFFEAPPLKKRREDIPLLVQHFMNRFNQENDTQKELADKALRYLKNYDWPGNIRELENIIEMICVTTEGSYIGVGDLPKKIFGEEVPREAKDSPVLVREIVPEKEALAAMERQLLAMAMEQCENNRQKAAELLGVDKSTITRKIHALGLNR